jgi:hypothetical protein
MNSNNNVFMIGGARDKNKESPADNLHKEALDYLKNVLNLSDIDARAYKSIAYRLVKEQNPEAKHMERAEKLVELVKSKNFVKENKDKLEDTKKILENIDSEKEKRESEQEPKQNGGNFSETSVMQNYTESKVNQPYYQEYMNAKSQYLQSKLQKGGANFQNNMIPVPLNVSIIAPPGTLNVTLINFANLNNINNYVINNLNNGSISLNGTINAVNIVTLINNRNATPMYANFIIEF